VYFDYIILSGGRVLMNHLILLLFVVSILYLLGMMMTFFLPIEISKVHKVKFKKRFPFLIAIIVVFFISYLPHSISHFEQDDIQTIKIKDGNTGLTLEIKKMEIIQQITGNLNSVIFKKRSNSLFRMGYSFDLELMNDKEEVKKRLIVNTTTVIRYKGFFYDAVENELDYNYIQELFKEAYPEEYN